MSALLSMETSSSSKLFEISRILEHLEPNNLETMKQLLITELNCKNENEFLCVAVRSLFKSIKPETMTLLKNKALELAEEHAMNDSKSKSLFAWLQQQCNDNLSQLPSDIIDQLGSYLTKKESIKFGFLNKHLYIYGITKTKLFIKTME